eukprot:gene11311-biopygen21395
MQSRPPPLPETMSSERRTLPPRGGECGPGGRGEQLPPPYPAGALECSGFGGPHWRTPLADPTGGLWH